MQSGQTIRKVAAVLSTHLDGWIVQTKSEGRHLLLERAGMPGLVHITADTDALRVSFFRESHASVAVSIEAPYQGLRSKPRLLVAQRDGDTESAPGSLVDVLIGSAIEVGEWRMLASQIIADDYRRHCLEIRHLGRPGMIHAGADRESVSVEVWDHAVEHVVDAACVIYD